MKETLIYTGERVIPHMFYYSDGFMEHLARYDFAKQFCMNKTVIDVGCGFGYGTKYLSGFAERCIGVDISKEAIDYASATYGDTHCRFFNMSCLEIGKLGMRFDVCVAFELIEHIHEKEQMIFLQSVADILKGGGKFIVSTPNRLTQKIPNKFHVKELSPSEFQKLLGEYFQNVKIFSQNVSPYSLTHFRHHSHLEYISMIIKNFYKKIIGKLLPLSMMKMKLVPGEKLDLSYNYSEYFFSNFVDIKESDYLVAICSQPFRSAVSRKEE